MKKENRLILLPDNLIAIIIEKDNEPCVVIQKDFCKSKEGFRIRPIHNRDRAQKFLNEYYEKHSI